MGKTKIEWVRNPDGTQGETVNYVVGCSGDGCEVKRRGKCYASRIAKRFKNRCQLCYEFKPHFHFNRLTSLPIRWGCKPKGYFLSMGELFDAQLRLDISTVKSALKWMDCRHRFYILTKQAQRLKNFSFPPNVWLGVSVNIQKDVWRIDELRKTNVRIKFVSFEPLYEQIDCNLTGIDWVIIGAETTSGKTTFYPELDWLKTICTQARKLNIPIFLKDNLNLTDLYYNTQEFPEAF